MWPLNSMSGCFPCPPVAAPNPHPGVLLHPHPCGQLGVPGVSQPSSGDIPLEMGRLCSGRPEKSQGQRGEVMVAASGVISLPHLRGALSDSAVVRLPRGRKFSSPHPRRALPALQDLQALPRCSPGRGWSPEPVPEVLGKRWASKS